MGLSEAICIEKGIVSISTCDETYFWGGNMGEGLNQERGSIRTVGTFWVAFDHDVSMKWQFYGEKAV